jgi:mRNA-degrading endonuclease RelE of RelBE toxin-antitoxin system
MNYRIKPTSLFEKQVKRLSRKYPSLKQDLSQLVEKLKLNPEEGTPLGKGFYKIRIAIESKGQGKSGGARVITFLISDEYTILLTSIYDKSEQSSVNTQVLLKILRDEGIIM